MSAQYDLARPAKQMYAMDTARLHMASKNASYLPSSSSQSTSRRIAAESSSLPQSSWLSDAAEFYPDPLSPSYHGTGVSAPGVDSLLGSNTLSEFGYSPRTVSHAQSRDHMLSTNHAAHPVSSSSRTQSRHSPSPIPSPSRTLHPSRSFTATPTHKPSGMSSDRDASGHLDMKRLMSKPAKQTASGSVSVLSDSERSADASSSRYTSAHRAQEGGVSRPPLSRSANASREREKTSLHVNTTGVRSSSAPRAGHTSSSTSSPERKAASSDGHMSKPSRNVLRRRPSAHSNPTSPPPAIAHVRAATDDIYLSRSGSMKYPQTSFRDDPPLAPYASRQMASVSTSAPGAATSVRTKPSVKTSKSPQLPSGLTPAGAVALAYKQQEQRREELAETASYIDSYRSPTDPTVTSLHKRDTDANNRGDEGGRGAYYTVFGGSSGRLVAVGSPDDDWLYGGFDARIQAAPQGQGKPAGSRSLSRKVSGSIKRVTGSMKRERDQHREASEQGNEEWKPFDGSQVGPGRHSPSQPSSNNARQPITLDTSLGGRNSPKGSPITRHGSAPKGTPSPQEDGRMSRSSRMKGRDREEEGSPGGMWSKLIKRISTGGLREKYNQDPAPPPVPALPAHISPIAASRATMDISGRGARTEEVSENGVLLRKFMQSRASLSGVRPNLYHPPKTPPSGPSRPSTSNGTGGGPTTGNTVKTRASIIGNRPSTATRSSSPGSSEVAAANFFNNYNRTPSSRSSFSSLGEEIPPVPKNVGRYIISPSELSRISKAPPEQATASQSKRARTPSRSVTAPPDETAKPKVVSSPEDNNVPSLPLPPRRATTGHASSPSAPSFSVEDTINNFMPPQPSAPPPLTEFGGSEPPPRPKRSSRRVPPPTLDVPVHPQAMLATLPHSPATPRGHPNVRVNVDLIRRPSTGALSYASTAKAVSAGSSNSPASALSSSTSPSSAASQKRSPLTFREMESPRARLTEKEKADKWEDLLERSARAGGTLHLSDKHLLSDNHEVDGDDSFMSTFDSDE